MLRRIREPNQISLSRRAALKGMGVALALPWMESLAPAAVASAGPPVRMAFLFVPNGVHMPDWKPQTNGYGFQLPYILEPLREVQNDLLVLTGLTHDKGRDNGDGAGDHARSASVFLTGAQPRKTSGSNIRSGMSVDQVAAKTIGQQTRFPSLELGCERGRSAGNCDSGYSCAYSSSISWAGPASPMSKESDPKLVFQRLFASQNATESDRAATERNALRKSILDYVADDARQIQRRLSRTDHLKLDEYLTGVREIERRMERQTSDVQSPSELDYPVPKGVPSDYGEHIRLMCDMIVLAFQTDATRVSTFMLADAGSNRPYAQLGIPDGHHDLSHHGGDPKKHAKIRQINRFHMEQFAYLLTKLKSIPEGNGNLLDYCMIAYGSGLGDGNRHNHDDLPMLLAGHGGGTIDPGRHIQYPIETPMTNLFVSMLERAGSPVDVVGDSTGPLPGLQI